MDVTWARGHSGTGRYVRELVTALAPELPESDSLLLYASPGDWGPDARELQAHPSIRIRWVGKLVHPHLRTQVLFPHLIARDHLDVFHAPSFFAPLAARVPVVVNIHDVNWWDRRQDWFLAGSRKAYVDLAVQMRFVAWKAETIVALSAAAADRIAERLRVSRERIEVIRPGPGEVFRTAPATAVGGTYFLGVGTLCPQKNQAATIRALAHLRRAGLEADLMLVGRDPRSYRSTVLEPLARSLGVHGSVTFRSGVTDEELRDLYASSVALLFPSHAEGFGLPILEAMAAGTAVITSHLSSMPEVGGDAALYVDPHDARTLAQAMYRLLTEAGERARLVVAGSRRVEAFSWRAAARQFVDLYHRMAAPGAVR